MSTCVDCILHVLVRHYITDIGRNAHTFVTIRLCLTGELKCMTVSIICLLCSLSYCLIHQHGQCSAGQLSAHAEVRKISSPLHDCVHFNYCSLIASALAAAPQLCHESGLPHRARSCRIQLLLPNSIRFSYCSPVVSACSPSCSGRFQHLLNILEHSSLS